MPLKTYSVEFVSGHSSSGERAIAFLESNDNPGKVNAKTAFNAMDKKPKRILRKRFDLWISGVRSDKAFHGWPNDAEYKDCFVFKWQKGHQLHRMYGFLCHPILALRPRFQLCILTLDVTKNEHETDRTELARIVVLSRDREVLKAVSVCFV